jgi:Ca-activated chloride channel family protein
VTSDGRELPLRGASIRAEAGAGLARTVVEQRFSNPHDEPLRVLYRLPLPVDGAVAGFRFQLGDRTVTGEIRARTEAREAFEQALVEGRTAGLLEQERTNLFTQEIANLPPHTDVYAEITVDHPIAWLTDGSWEYRFPTVIAPRYLGAPGRIDDAARVSIPVAEGDLPPRVTLALRVRDALANEGRATSPSHTIRGEAREEGLAVSLADSAGVPLDRDLVVRWPVATPEPGACLEVARPAAEHASSASAFGLLTLVPPLPAAHVPPVARDLIVLLDTSGSMSGEPLAQARALVEAVVDSLTDQDRFEILAFSSEPHRWRPQPVRATPDARAAAHAWLSHLQAGGGTEMTEAIKEALAPLRGDAQRQVLLVTDGLVGFEHEIVWHVLNCLPHGSRLHAVGVGPSVNRALTASIARAGRGTEVIVAADEPVETAAGRLVARTTTPLALNVEVSGSALQAVAPARLPDVFLGAPCTVALRLRPVGGELVVRADLAGEAWEQRLTVHAIEPGTGRAAVVARYGREAVADVEMQSAAGNGSTGDAEIERLGLAFAISTRLTSWIAVTTGPTVDATQPTRRVEMPHAVPAGLSPLGLGLRGAKGGATLALAGEATLLKSGLRGTHRLGGVLKRALVSSLLDDVLGGELVDNGASPARQLTGRLLTAAPDRIVVEFEVRDSALTWDPTAPVTLVLVDGSRIEASVSADGTTVPGRIEAGLTVRLAVRLDRALPVKLREVLLVAGGTMLAIEIEKR